MEQILYNDPNIIFVNHIEEYQGPKKEPDYYTHLTLPTILRV